MQPTLPFTFLYYRVEKESVEIKEIKKVKCNSDIYTKSYDEENGMRPCESPPNIRQRAAMPGGLYFFDF
jgi:hypothetical protein